MISTRRLLLDRRSSRVSTSGAVRAAGADQASAFHFFLGHGAEVLQQQAQQIRRQQRC
jgi:hypothetical protein